MNQQSLNLIEKIQRIKCQLQKFLESEDYQILCQFQKQTCSKISYIIKLVQLHYQQPDILLNTLENGLKMISMILKSTQYEKYGHKFNYYAFVLRKFQLISNSKIVFVNNQKTMERAYKNQQSSYYRDQQQTQIQAQELHFTKSKNFNNFVRELSQNQIVLQNTQCICCSQVFIKNYVIQNKNPYIPLTIQLSSKIAFQNNQLEKQLIALCNQGGGAILIGAQRKQGSIRALGIKFNDQISVKIKQQYILSVIQSLKPSCRFLVQRVIVQTNVIIKELPLLQYLRFCFRILIFPYSVHKITYVEHQRKKNQKYCEVYNYKRKSKQSQKVNPSYLYQQIHQIYYQKKNSFRNSHENIFCTRPHLNYSKLFYEQYYQKKQSSLLQSQKFQECPQQPQKNKPRREEDPVFNLQQQCLFIIASKNYMKRIYKFLDCLTQNNQKHEISKPFCETYKDCTRSVWMISHQMKFTEIKDMLKDYEKRNYVPSAQIITIMPIQPILQVLVSKFTEYYQKALQQKLREHFQDNLFYQKKRSQIYDYKHKKSKKIYYLKFASKVRSLYAYLFFQKANLRPYFVSEDDCEASFQD